MLDTGKKKEEEEEDNIKPFFVYSAELICLKMTSF